MCANNSDNRFDGSIDLGNAKRALFGRSVAFCKGSETVAFDGKGISPLMQAIKNGYDFQGFAVADAIVGKAAAMLFCKMKVAVVYGRVTSKSAFEYLARHDIPCSYDVLTENIVNRTGSDVCPMEKAVCAIEDCEEGYIALSRALSELQKGKDRAI